MTKVVISDSALGLLRKLPEHARKEIARTIEALRVSPDTKSVPLNIERDLRMGRAGDYRVVYKIEKTDSSLLVLSIFRPEDNAEIEKMLMDYLNSRKPAELTNLFNNASIERVRDIWVESDENTEKGRRIVGTGTVQIQGSIGPAPQKEDVQFSFEALLDQSGSLSEVKKMDLDVYAD
jgi:mRNA-degrading endonuclease RelE of RelBE toxin-antitoxin system